MTGLFKRMYSAAQAARLMTSEERAYINGLKINRSGNAHVDIEQLLAMQDVQESFRLAEQIINAQNRVNQDDSLASA